MTNNGRVIRVVKKDRPCNDQRKMTNNGRVIRVVKKDRSCNDQRKITNNGSQNTTQN